MAITATATAAAISAAAAATIAAADAAATIAAAAATSIATSMATSVSVAAAVSVSVGLDRDMHVLGAGDVHWLDDGLNDGLHDGPVDRHVDVLGPVLDNWDVLRDVDIVGVDMSVTVVTAPVAAAVSSSMAASESFPASLLDLVTFLGIQVQGRGAFAVFLGVGSDRDSVGILSSSV
jgi:outer membrane receptor protein involved in Fe transport